MTQNPGLKSKILNALRGVLTAPQFEPVLLRVSQGRRLEGWSARILPNHYQYPKPSPRAVSRRGIGFDLDIADICDWALYFDLRDPDTERLFSLVRPGDTVIDVGSNIGHMALNFARRCGPTGQVLGFEPDPITFGRLTRNLALNSFKNIRVANMGLGEKPARLKLSRLDPRNPGKNRILPAGKEEGQVAEVEVVRLDDHLKSNPVSRVDLIKIDVEGFEMGVLLGARESIERWHPKLYIEVIDRNLRAHGHSARGLLLWLEQRGYHFILAGDGQTLPVEAVMESFSRDVIAFPS